MYFSQSISIDYMFLSMLALSTNPVPLTTLQLDMVIHDINHKKKKQAFTNLSAVKIFFFPSLNAMCFSLFNFYGQIR